MLSTIFKQPFPGQLSPEINTFLRYRSFYLELRLIMIYKLLQALKSENLSELNTKAVGLYGSGSK